MGLTISQRQKLSRAKSGSVVLLTCAAALFVTNGTTRKVKAVVSDAANLAAAGSPATTPSTSTVNGKIVFISDRQSSGDLTVWTMNPDGSNPTQLTARPTGSTYVYDEQPKWSPDGSKIAFRSFGRGDYASNSIYLMNADGSDLRQVLIDLSGIKEAVEIGSFTWSPDATKFLFDAGAYITVDGFAKLTANIFVVGIDGKNVMRLTNDGQVMNTSAAWSPDGRMLAFASNSQDGTGTKIHVMNADGSNRHVVASGYQPSWSPDSTKILFVSPGQIGSCDTYICDQLYTVNSDGSNLAQLTGNAAPYAWPTWSPDGKKIISERQLLRRFATSVGDYGHAIFVMEANGSNQNNISNRHVNLLGATTEEDYQPDWQPLSASPSDPTPSVLGFSELLYQPTSSPFEVRVIRSGNVNQNVSCDYQTERDLQVSAPVSLSFAPGETSKTIQVSDSLPMTVTLSNNAGNATFLGGNKATRVLFGIGNSNPIDNSAYFVRQHYRDLLSREPDFLGMDFWTNYLEFCGSECQQNRRISTSAAFFLSIEFQQTGYLVELMYKVAYGDTKGASTRNGSHQLEVPIVRFNEFLSDTQQIGAGVVVGQSGWETILENNKQSFAADFVQRSRFTSALPTTMTPAQFIDKLNANAGNVLSASDLAAAIGLFGTSTDTSNVTARAQALRQVTENQNLVNAEFNRAFVLMQYLGYLRRNPNDSPDADYTGYDFWLTKLNQFNGNFIQAEMVKAFITSTEYRRRFGP